MGICGRRMVAALAVTVVVVTSGLVAAGPAGAGRVVSGSLVFSGDADDPVTRGQSYSFSTDGAVFNARGIGDRQVSLFVDGGNGQFWSLDLSAPLSQTMAPGDYTGATHSAPDENTPTMNLSGNGVDCTGLSGSFHVSDIVFGPNGYVQTFDATFEQRCDGFAGTARGEVHIANPPPPPALEAGLTVDATGEVSAGLATLHGNVTCTKPTTVGLGTSVTQKVKGTQVNGGVFVIVDCTPGAPVPWTGEAQALGPVGFRQGDLDVQIQGTAIDFDYDQVIVLDATTVVRLRKVRA